MDLKADLIGICVYYPISFCTFSLRCSCKHAKYFHIFRTFSVCYYLECILNDLHYTGGIDKDKRPQISHLRPGGVAQR